jgi:hypothetical protein
LRRLLVLGLALCGLAQAQEPAPRLDLAATAAWGGWSRAERATEIDLRLTAGQPGRVALELRSGRQTVVTEVDLQPGRPARVQMPVAAAASISARARAADGAEVQRTIELKRSSSPLLAVALAAGATLAVAPFHAVAVGAADLPRQATAYAAIDALVLDASLLTALDARQTAALLGHAAACGRIVVLQADAPVRRLLAAGGGCGAHALSWVASPEEARQALLDALSHRLPEPMSLGATAGLRQPDGAVWTRIAVAVVVCFAAMALVLLFSRQALVLLLAPALAAAAMLALLQLQQPATQLMVWGEGGSGAPLARYQAWQQVQGVAHERIQVPIPAALGGAVQACDTRQALHLHLDAERGQAVSATFDSRLFGRAWLCFAGSFPTARNITAAPRADGTTAVRNAGTQAWPAGRLMIAGQVYDLPALAGGAPLTLPPPGAGTPRGAELQLAASRIGFDGRAALWPLDLTGVVDAGTAARGWLLVALEAP